MGETEKYMRARIQWINWAKFVAMVAVLVDHSYGILYTNHDIAIASYFSVSLFIIVSGMTSYISNQIRISEKWHQTFWRSSSKMIVAYLVAAFFCQVLKTHTFNLKDYCIGVLHFNISGPFYYVALYLQIMFISRPLFNLIRESSLKRDIIVGGCILVVASLTTRYTDILGIYGGGGKLFGGTYLICYYIGMMLEKYNLFNENHKKSISFAVIGVIGYYGWWKFVCIDGLKLDKKLPWGEGINPPSISLIIMAIIVLCMVYGVCNSLKIIKCNKIVDGVSGLGGHTLYIFLYHKVLLEMLSGRIQVTYKVVEVVIYFGVMIAGPILIEYIVDRGKNYLLRR